MLSFLFVIIVPLVSNDEPKYSLIQITLSIRVPVTAYTWYPNVPGNFDLLFVSIVYKLTGFRIPTVRDHPRHQNFMPFDKLRNKLPRLKHLWSQRRLARRADVEIDTR